MMGEERFLPFMTEASMIQISIHWFAEQINGPASIWQGSERANALLLLCIHWDMFLHYDKIIDICASKYPRRMLLTNTLSEI